MQVERAEHTHGDKAHYNSALVYFVHRKLFLGGCMSALHTELHHFKYTHESGKPLDIYNQASFQQ
jgi:hypothetical protein